MGQGVFNHQVISNNFEVSAFVDALSFCQGKLLSSKDNVCFQFASAILTKLGSVFAFVSIMRLVVAISRYLV